MKVLIDDIEKNGERGQRPIPRSADVTPETMPKVREAVQ
jgi:hypothetical protein